MTVDPVDMWAYATRPIADQCAATITDPATSRRHRCALSAGHYRVINGRGPDEANQSWHTDDPDMTRSDGVTWADTARNAVAHNAPEHVRHAIENGTEDAPLLAVLAAADAAEPRVVRASRGAMVDGRFEVPADDVQAEQQHKAQVRDELAAAKQRTRRDVAAVIT